MINTRNSSSQRCYRMVPGGVQQALADLGTPGACRSQWLFGSAEVATVSSSKRRTFFPAAVGHCASTIDAHPKSFWHSAHRSGHLVANHPYGNGSPVAGAMLRGIRGDFRFMATSEAMLSRPFASLSPLSFGTAARSHSKQLQFHRAAVRWLRSGVRCRFSRGEG